MTDITGIRGPGWVSRFLQIVSSHDIHAHAVDHNPADFTVSMPNSMGSDKIRRVVASTVSIPRRFYNIYEPNNKFILWRRPIAVAEIGPNIWRIAGDYDWIPLEITIPPGVYTPTKLITTLTMLPGNDWIGYGYDSETGKFTINGPYYTWPFFDVLNEPESPPAPPEFIPQCYVTEAKGSHLFDILGLVSARMRNDDTMYASPTYQFEDFLTGDNIANTSMDGYPNPVPLFNASAHNLSAYLYQSWIVPNVNPLNLEGPVWVNVVIKELGDNSTIDTETGKPLDVVATVPMTETPYNTYVTRRANDADVEGIQFKDERSVRAFKVQLQDLDGNVLVLPRNWPVFIRLQLLQTTQ